MFFGAITFNPIDIAIYAFVILFCIIGLCKGLVKIIFSLLKGVSTFIISYFLTSPLSNLLSKTGLYDLLYGKIFDFLKGKSEMFSLTIDSNNYKDQIIMLSNELGIPEFIGKILSNVITISESSLGLTIGEALSNSVTHVTITAISFIILLIVISILILVLSKFFTYLVSLSGLKTIDRVLGMLLNGVFGLAIVCVVFLVFAALSSGIPMISDLFNDLLYPEGYNSEDFSIAVWFFENNPFKFIFENMVK